MKSLAVDGLTNITLETLYVKYRMRLQLLFTVSEMIETELTCRFTEFFDLACFALNQIVRSVDSRR